MRDILTRDGYIVDQRLTRGMPYGRLDSATNGCGWIAAYNLARAADAPDDAEAVRRGMDALLPFSGYFGTPFGTLGRFLRARFGDVEKSVGRRNAQKACAAARAGVVRYVEGYEPHYVAFVWAGGEQYRFFNAIAGRDRHLDTMQNFFETRVKFPFARAYTLPRG